MNNKQKYALISTYDKKNLFEICKNFKKFNIKIISTGSTAKNIKNLGFKCLSVSNLTKFKEILDGRVKTLHHKIHASLLYDRENKSHVQTFKKLNFPDINFVIINLYPFQEIIKKTKNIKKCIEMIDIGGPSILRSSAKNFQFITTISDPNQYEAFIKLLKKNRGTTSLAFRKKMAQVTFEKTSEYDSLISSWFLKKKPNSISFNKLNKTKLKYGENPNQNSFFYQTNLLSIFDFKFHGKQLSYNNILDINAGLDCLKEFNEPTCVIIKHNNPCGVSSKKNIKDAFINALNADSLSAFGGIVLLNKKVDKLTAEKLNICFFEVIGAPSFSTDAQNLLMKKKNLILLNTKKLIHDDKQEIKSVIGGYLLQDKNKVNISKKILQKVSFDNSRKYEEDLIFALKVCKHVKSNAIVLAKNKQTIGIGAGQMSRIDSVNIALKKTKSLNVVKNFVAASDAFFPFIDSISLLKKNGCKAVVQPKGSLNDRKNVDFANKFKLSLYFINKRLFRH